MFNHWRLARPASIKSMTKPEFSIWILRFTVALAVVPLSGKIAGLAATMEESAATPTEIVAETAVPGDVAGHIAEIAVAALANAVAAADGIASTLTILGTEIRPGSHRRLSWSATGLFEGVPISTPVLVELELTQVKSPHSGRIIGMSE
jgi:hypothetical protein